MRLITWNCKGAFTRKRPAIEALHPDVLVVPEAEKLSTLRSVQWFGENPKKGLAVLSYGEYSLDVHDAYDPRHRWIVPIQVSGPMPFLLIAVWAMPHETSRLYVQCLFEALETYKELLRWPRVVWAGDFNNNVALDRRRHALKFADWLARVETMGFRSLYHLHHRCEHGAEPHQTFFLHHDAEKPFHIDFIFAKPDEFPFGYDVEVGEHGAWSKASDHMPVVCSFREGALNRVRRKSRPSP